MAGLAQVHLAGPVVEAGRRHTRSPALAAGPSARTRESPPSVGRALTVSAD